MIRKMSHAGSFYPRFGEQISTLIRGWTEDQKTALASERCLGLIVPHAGYVYSGKCATLGFHYISEQAFDAFIILHPSHHGVHFDYNVSAFEQYDTPYGLLELDLQLYEQLTRRYGQREHELYLHEAEHSMEIQLPFIKYYFPEARICPVMIGRQNPEVAQNLAQSLFEVLKDNYRRIGIIVSTDLSHYHSSVKAEAMDAIVEKAVAALDPESLWQSVIQGRCEACGIGGVLTLLYLARKYDDAQARIIDYTHSGITSGNMHQVVGYLSALVFRPEA